MGKRYKSTCKQLYKQAKKVSNLERTLAEERTSFGSLLADLRYSLASNLSSISLTVIQTMSRLR